MRDKVAGLTCWTVKCQPRRRGSNVRNRLIALAAADDDDNDDDDAVDDDDD